MRIACPSCAAEYEVPEARLTPQKMVRCSRCGGEWIALREADMPQAGTNSPETGIAAAPPPEDHPAPDHPLADPAPLPTVTAMDRLAAPPPKPPRNTGLIAAWLVTGVVLIVAVAAVLTWRQAVVHAWPPSSRILGRADPVAPSATPAPSPGTSRSGQSAD